MIEYERLEPILEEFGIPVGHCGERTGCPYPRAVIGMATEIDKVRSLVESLTERAEKAEAKLAKAVEAAFREGYEEGSRTGAYFEDFEWQKSNARKGLEK